MVGAAMPAAHAVRDDYSCARLPCASVRRRRMLLSVHISAREAPAVDLALKLNVLAVCAVFVFVGAILLGAF